MDTFKKIFIMVMFLFAISAWYFSPANSRSYNIVPPEEITCLAKNIYFESRNESTAGKLAVALTTLNRVKDPKFPSTICDVVHQGGERLNRCQFSWYCDGKPDTINNERSWDESVYMASEVLFRKDWIFDITDGARFYHADYVSPRWAKVKKKTTQIDTHIFYR